MTKNAFLTAEQAAPTDLRADVVVIGSGASGQSVARRLARHGADVLMVEAGSTTEIHRKSQPLLQAAMPAVHREYPDFGGHLLMKLGGAIGKPQMPMSVDGSKPSDGIRLARLTDADFTRWPIDRADLDPYYYAVSEEFGVDWAAHECPVFDDDRLHAAPFHVVSRTRFSDPTPEHLESVRVLIEAPVSKLDIDDSGKVVGAQVNSASGTTLALSADTFVLAMNSMPATQLLLNSGWSGGQQAANSSGMLGHFLMDHPLVTLGYIEPAADLDMDLLRSLMPQPISNGLFWPKLTPDETSVANGSNVNAALTLVPLIWSVARNRFRHRTLKPVVTGARTGARHSLERVTNQVRSRQFSRATISDSVNVLRGIDELAMVKFRPAGPQFNLENGWFRDSVEGALPKTFEIAGMVEQTGRFENKVELTDELNAAGWRKLRATWQYSREDQAAVHKATQPIIDALDDGGLGRFHLLPTHRRTENVSCHHASGTTRMSADATEGVVDSNSRTHDHDNLYIAGMSVFPSVGYANPTLTSMALGARIADHVAGAASPKKEPQHAPTSDS